MTERWTPNYIITPTIANALMRIEAATAVVAHTPLPLAVEARLRERARLRSTHYSTYIEGNRLTLAETREVVEQRGVTFHGRERDVAEVRNYWQALLRVEEWAARGQPLTEELIRRLHALVAYVFALAQQEALACAQEGLPAEPEALRRLDHRARTVLALFARHDEITTTMVAAALGLSPRMARTLLSGWVADGWLQPATTAKKNRTYLLTAVYRQYIGGLSAEDQEYRF